MIRAPDLKSGGRESSFMLINSQLVCLLPAGISKPTILVDIFVSFSLSGRPLN